MKALGTILIIQGIRLFVGGAVHLSDPPLPPLRPQFLYSTSGQLEAIGCGIIGVVLGIIIWHKSGEYDRDRI